MTGCPRRGPGSSARRRARRRRGSASSSRADRLRGRDGRALVAAALARAALGRAVAAVGASVPLVAASSWDEHRQQHLREEVVDDEDRDARRHHRARGRDADALGAARGVEAEVARRDAMIPPKTNGFTSPWMKSFGMKPKLKPPAAIWSHTVRQ